MPKYCQVPNCNQENDDEVIYHQFPKDSQLKQKWLVTMGRPDYKPTSTSLICSKHFEETDFTYRFGKKTLRVGVVPSIFNGTKIKSDEEPQKPKEKSHKATRSKYSFYIPHYVLVHKEFLNSGGSLNLERLSGLNLSPPILYGIGNTSTVINSSDAVTSPFLKRKRKEDSQKNENYLPRSEGNCQRNRDASQSNAIKELAEIHSYNKKPDDLLESGPVLDNKEKTDDEEKKEVTEGHNNVQGVEISSNDTLQIPRKRYRLVKFSDCSLETLKNPTTAKAAWSIIQRTLDSQQRKIRSLQSEHAALQNELQQLEDNIKEITETETEK